MLVFLNPAAGGGRALSRWERIAPRITETTRIQVHLLGNQEDGLQVLEEAVKRGESEIVAAGGDGTVNAVLTMLMHESMRDALRGLTLGAIGLGSSNDFHKPASDIVETCPCKLRFADARPRDVGVLATGLNGTGVYRYFLNNASLGATADANRRFNEPDRLLRWLKRVSTPAAILYTALSTIAWHRDSTAIMTAPLAGSAQVRLSNLGVLKNSHVSGALHYDPPGLLDDGLLGIRLCQGMTRRELVRVLFALSRGRFSELPRTVSWSDSSLTIVTNEPVNIEFDGEITSSCSVRFTVMHNILKVCP